MQPETYQSNLRKDVLSFLKINSFQINSILEIGGGAGYTSQAISIKNQAKAINIDIQLPKLKAKSIEHIKADFCEEATIKKLTINDFDLILALDVIEHIADTKLFFKNLSKITKHKNKVLVSLPNIKNIRIPYNIYLKNTFPRNNAGIFDETHLRWFTKKDIENLFKDNHFKIIKTSYTDHRSFFVRNRLVSKIIGSYIAPQFLVLAERF